jgi:hypothetical protein
MNVSRLSRGEQIAGASGIALLLIMFIFDWFSYGTGPISVGGNAWDTMELIRFILLLAAFSGIAVAVMSASESTYQPPVAASSVAAGLGILSVVLVLFRIISPPDFGASGFGVDLDVGRSIGVFLGLIASAGVAYGGWAAMQEEGTSFGAQADTSQGDDPPPPPPPAAGPPAGGPPAA